MAEQSFVHGGHRGGFLDRLADGLLHALAHAIDAEDISRRDGLLQHLDPRVKTAGLLGLVVVVVSVRSLAVLAVLFALAVLLGLASHISPLRLARQVWLGVLFFTGAIALPALVLVPGDTIAHVPFLAWPISAQGVRSAAFLLGRSETSATFALLLILSTPWTHVLKALRTFRVPAVLVVILGMTHRYIFVLLQTAAQMAEARRSRMIGRLPPRERRRLVTASAGVLLGKALHLSGDVHLAMIARGYRGEVHLLDDFRMRPRDWIAIAGFALVAALASSLHP